MVSSCGSISYKRHLKKISHSIKGCLEKQLCSKVNMYKFINTHIYIQTQFTKMNASIRVFIIFLGRQMPPSTHHHPQLRRAFWCWFLDTLQHHGPQPKTDWQGVPRVSTFSSRVDNFATYVPLSLWIRTRMIATWEPICSALCPLQLVFTPSLTESFSEEHALNKSQTSEPLSQALLPKNLI